MDAADAILSTLGAQTATWQFKEAAKARARGEIGDTFVNVAEKLGQLPSLIEQGKNDREIRDINQAALGGYLHSGADGMRDAVLAFRPTTKGGQAAAFGHLARWDEMKNRAMTLAAHQATLDHERALEEANVAANEPVLDQPTMGAAIGLGMVPGGEGASRVLGENAMRPPTYEEQSARFAKIPHLRLGDLNSLRADDRIRDIAAENARVRSERDAALAASKAAELQFKERQAVADRAARVTHWEEQVAATYAGIKAQDARALGRLLADQEHWATQNTVNAAELAETKRYHDAQIRRMEKDHKLDPLVIEALKNARAEINAAITPAQLSAATGKAAAVLEAAEIAREQPPGGEVPIPGSDEPPFPGAIRDPKSGKWVRGR